MRYSVTMTSPAHKMLKKLSPDIRKYIVKRAQALAQNSQLGEQLRGELRAFRSLHAVYRNTDYRVIYEINHALKEIIVRAVGSRENLYKNLRRMKLRSMAS